MFDIGFTEILVISIIALFVIGPEKLPETIKTFSIWFGRFKRSLRETRRELEKQIGADEIRRELHNEEVMKNLSNLQQEVNKTLNEKISIEDEEDEASYYPPGHMDHDPNNNIEDDIANDQQFLEDNGLTDLNIDTNTKKSEKSETSENTETTKADADNSDASKAQDPGDKDSANDKSIAG